MTDLASRVGARADRLGRAFAGVQTRFAPLFPGGEVQDTGHAIWTVSKTPLRVVNGVIRYDARDFHGPESERELDSCLAVLSTYDVPWRFSAWDHLGADVLVPHLVVRGMVGTGSVPAMWLDLPGRALTTAAPTTATPTPTTATPKTATPKTAAGEGIEIRSVTDASDHHEWTQIFTNVFGIPSEYSDLFEQIVAEPGSRSVIAHANGRPVGCLSMSIEEGVAVVYNVGVLPSARRRGVGRRLLQAAHKGAAARGADACVVVATRAGSGICTRLGYHAVTRVSYLMPAPALK